MKLHQRIMILYGIVIGISGCDAVQTALPEKDSAPELVETKSVPTVVDNTYIVSPRLNADTTAFINALRNRDYSTADQLHAANLVDANAANQRAIWQSVVPNIYAQNDTAAYKVLSLFGDESIISHQIDRNGETILGEICGRSWGSRRQGETKNETTDRMTAFLENMSSRTAYELTTYVIDYEICYDLYFSGKLPDSSVYKKPVPANLALILQKILPALIENSDPYAVMKGSTDNLVSIAIRAAILQPASDGFELELLRAALRQAQLSSDTPNTLFTVASNKEAPLPHQIYTRVRPERAFQKRIDRATDAAIRVYTILADEFNVDLSVSNKEGETVRRRALRDGNQRLANFFEERGVPL